MMTPSDPNVAPKMLKKGTSKISNSYITCFCYLIRSYLLSITCYFILLKKLPPIACRRIVFLDLYSGPFVSSERVAWYTPSSSLHTSFMTSVFFVLPLCLPIFVSIRLMTFPLCCCHVIDQHEDSTFFTSASNRAVPPHNISFSPCKKISGSSITKKTQQFRKKCYTTKKKLINTFFNNKTMLNMNV